MLDHFAILGAMRGNIGGVVPLDTKTVVDDTSRVDLLGEGKMIHRRRDGSGRSQNTTISAIPVVASISVRARRAPLPTAILTAKSVFVANAGGSDLAFDTVYSELKSWARYALVDDPAKSDLVFEVSFGEDGSGAHVYTNAGTGMTYSYHVYLVRLAIIDSKTKTVLWRSFEKPESARRDKNREKNLIKSAGTLVTNLKERMEDKRK